MFDFGFYSQEHAYLDPPDEPEYMPERDWDFEYESRREDEILGRE